MPPSRSDNPPAVAPVSGGPAPDSAATLAERAGILSSELLLGGRAAVIIDHHGERYLLRATRSGKLILTK